MLKRFISATSVAQSIHPPFNKPVLTRRATVKHLRKMKEQMEKLGDRFTLLAKHRRYPGLPGYKEPSPIPPAKFIPFMLDKTNTNPKPIVPGSIKESQETTPAPSPKKDFKIQLEHIPKPVYSKASLDPLISAEKLPETDASSGPYYAFGLRPSEVKFILQDTPEALKAIKDKLSSVFQFNSEGKTPTLDEQAEMVRRVISMDNGSNKDFQRANIQRMQSLLQRTPTDVGSPEAQAGALTVKIEAIRKHLEQNKKDTPTKQRLLYWEGKRQKALKYLRRKNLEKFVETCKVIGVDPESIRA